MVPSLVPFQLLGVTVSEVELECCQPVVEFGYMRRRETLVDKNTQQRRVEIVRDGSGWNDICNINVVVEKKRATGIFRVVQARCRNVYIEST